MRKSPLEKVFTLDYMIKYGYFDFEPRVTKSIQEDVHAKSGRTQIVYYDMFNLESMVQNRELMRWLTGYLNVSNLIEEAQDTEPIVFTIPKSAEVRRTLKVPNFWAYVILAKYLLDHKTDIMHDIVEDRHSTSKYFGQLPYNFQNTLEITEDVLFGKQFILKLDLSNFYHTMYTHSIPWMHMGKLEAKKVRSGGYSNTLDKLVRHEQFGETHGLPTGNLLTRIIAEHYMAKFDQRLDEYNSEFSFVRYVDDVTVGFNNDVEKSAFLYKFREIAVEHELIINEHKVREMTYDQSLSQGRMIEYFESEGDMWESIKKLRGRILRFIRLGQVECAAGIKGSDKLIFSGIIKLIKDNGNSIRKIDMLSRALSDGEYNSLLQMLLDITFRDSRLGVYFFSLLDELASRKTIVFTRNRVQRKLHNVTASKIKVIEQAVIHASESGHQQEVYNILLLMEKSKNIFSYDVLSKMSLEDMDDMSLILWLSQAMKAGNITDVFQRMDTLLNSEYNYKNDMFVQKYWMLRYEFYRLVFKNKIRSEIKNFYAQNNRPYHQLDIESMIKYQSSNPVRLGSERFRKNYLATDFYIILLGFDGGFSDMEFSF